MDRYVIITPTKNEEKYIEALILSVAKQEIAPLKWYILNDESTDKTTEIINFYASKYKFIQHIKYSKFLTNFKTTGGRSANLKNSIRDKVVNLNLDFVIMFDSDVSFESGFLLALFQFLNSNSEYGLVTGHLVQDGIPEKIRNYESCRGAVRVYKKECYDKVGYLYPGRGEDQMDAYMVRFQGWKIKMLDIYYNHLKPEGQKTNIFSSHWQTGEFKGKIPYKFFFFTATLLKDLFSKPILLAPLIIMTSYINTRWIVKHKPYDIELTKYIRSNQSVLAEFTKIFSKKHHK